MVQIIQQFSNTNWDNCLKKVSLYTPLNLIIKTLGVVKLMQEWITEWYLDWAENTFLLDHSLQFHLFHWGPNTMVCTFVDKLSKKREAYLMTGKKREAGLQLSWSVFFQNTQLVKTAWHKSNISMFQTLVIVDSELNDPYHEMLLTGFF